MEFWALALVFVLDLEPLQLFQMYQNYLLSSNTRIEN